MSSPTFVMVGRTAVNVAHIHTIRVSKVWRSYAYKMLVGIDGCDFAVTHNGSRNEMRTLARNLTKDARVALALVPNTEEEMQTQQDEEHELAAFTRLEKD